MHLKYITTIFYKIQILYYCRLTLYISHNSHILLLLANSNRLLKAIRTNSSMLSYNTRAKIISQLL